MEWFRRWFGEEYLLVYEHRDREEAAREVRFLTSMLGLDGSELILDLCCGSGRHALPLAAEGRRVIGLDYSFPLLRIAREKMAPGAEWPRFIRADVRNMPFREEVFDVALSLFTSFGYFDDYGNRGLLRSVARLLRKNGKYYMDYLNPSRLLAGLVPETVREKNGITVIEQRTVNETACRIEKNIVLRCEGREETFRESVRLYSLEEMRGMLQDAGLTVEEVFGSTEGESYSESSPRMILWGKRI
ncbi:MAG: class I SAM-dependent methyltransferase [Candidatus Latescibacterota bacterium]